MSVGLQLEVRISEHFPDASEHTNEYVISGIEVENGVVWIELTGDDVPLFGGWTPTWEGDLCKGGHPPQSPAVDAEYGPTCQRCSRRLDLRPCLCGSQHGRLARSICPVRVPQDQRDAEVHLGRVEDEK